MFFLKCSYFVCVCKELSPFLLAFLFLSLLPNFYFPFSPTLMRSYPHPRPLSLGFDPFFSGETGGGVEPRRRVSKATVHLQALNAHRAMSNSELVRPFSILSAFQG